MDFIFTVLFPMISIGLSCFVLGRNSVNKEKVVRQYKYRRT